MNMIKITSFITFSPASMCRTRALEREYPFVRAKAYVFLFLLGMTPGCSHGQPTAQPPAERAKPAVSTGAPIKSPAEPEHKPAATAEAEPRKRAPEPSSGREETIESEDPLADLESEDYASPGSVGLRRVHKSDKPPARGCIQIKEQATRVWPSPGASSIVSVGNEFFVAGYIQAEKAERVFVVRLSYESLPIPLVTERVEKGSRIRVAPPGLGVLSPGAIALAFSDSDGAVYLRKVRIENPSAGGSLIRVAQRGADIRFAPAVSQIKNQPIVAWTEGTTPMEARLAVLDPMGNLKAVHRIKPPAMGAAAPVFVQGLSPPVLLVVDAREGFSPLIRVPLTPEGAPEKTEVAVPVGMVATPVELAAAHNGFGTYVGYTAVGQAATSAVGLIQIDPECGTVAPLVPGTGYGLLHVAAIDAPKALIFAADAPVQKGKDAGREIQVRLVDSRGMGPKTVVRGTDGEARQVKIARNQEGVVAVVYCDKLGVFVSWLRCDDA
ncbi:MAG: hypothetical protein JXA30_01760 [Deltaproteobacteria bacterium]|nr:hypothetical protein [Deltaproteobacteria bacterium]